MQVADENVNDEKAAKAAEQAGQQETAAKIYAEIFKKEPLNEAVANRLMILYRKAKKIKKELQVIDKAIKNFETFYRSSNRYKNNKKVEELSASLSRKTGLTDKKGNAAFEPEPIAKWKKRRLVVEKKLEG